MAGVCHDNDAFLQVHPKPILKGLWEGQKAKFFHRQLITVYTVRLNTFWDGSGNRRVFRHHASFFLIPDDAQPYCVPKNSSPTTARNPSLLTLFTTCKPFAGDVGRNQYAALRSWTRLEPRPQVIVVGDDPGSAKAAADLGLTHVPSVDRSVDGKPLVKSMFREATTFAQHDLLCYADADTLLLDNSLMEAAKAMAGRRDFLLTGASSSAVYQADGKLSEVQTYHVNARGVWGMDYFLFPRGSIYGMPPFPINQGGWDNWLVYSTRRRGATVIDATDFVHPIHLEHPPRVNPPASVDGYHHELDNVDHLFSLLDATHRLTAAGSLAPVRGWRQVRTVTRLPWLWPALMPLQPVVKAALSVTRKQREARGITVNGIGTRK